MPNIPVISSPFSAVYVGDAYLSTVLQKVFCLRTDGAAIKEEVEQVWNPATRTWEQDGDHVVTVTLTFLFGDDTTRKLVRGLSLAALDVNDPPGEQMYSLLLIHPQATLKESRWLPEVRTVRSWETNHQKDKGTQYVIEFEGRNRDATADLLIAETTATLKSSYLGVRSPY